MDDVPNMAPMVTFPKLGLVRQLLAPWMHLSVQGGRLRAAAEPVTWSASTLLVQSTLGAVLVLGDSMDLPDGSETFALTVHDTVGELAHATTTNARPPLANVNKIPDELRFLFAQSVSLQGEVALSEPFARDGVANAENGPHFSWILIQEKTERVLLFADESRPLNVGVTCSPAIITQVRARTMGRRVRL
jgi:hypothetical protein